VGVRLDDLSLGLKEKNKYDKGGNLIFWAIEAREGTG